MEFSKDYEDFGEIIIKKLRDENYEKYLRNIVYGKSMSLKDYSESPKNPNIDPEIQQLNDERFEFFNSLTENQAEVLTKYILNILDSTAFNFLREVEENLEQNESIGFTINGNNVENITSEFLSGTLFGEYFLCAEKKSKFGEFQQ